MNFQLRQIRSLPIERIDHTGQSFKLNSPGCRKESSINHLLNITLTEFFAEERPQLEPELRRLVDTARKLSPEQLDYLQKLLESLSKD